MTKLQTYTKNACALALSTLLIRTLSVLYNGVITQKIGADGMGLYTLVLSVYGFAVTFAVSGIGLAATRLCAEAYGKNDESALRMALRQCLLYATISGFAAATILFSLAAPIGTGILKDVRTVPSLRLLALSLPPIALSSVFTGYFNVVSASSRNAVAAACEQIIRMYLTSYILTIMMPSGIEYACVAIVLGSCISEFLYFLFLLIQFVIFRKKAKRNAEENGKKNLWKDIFSVTVPLSVSTYIRSGLTTVEHVLIPWALVRSGRDRETALASYGVLHGMALPILLYPAGILASFTGLLLPETAADFSREHPRHIRYMTERALSFAYLFSLAAGGVLFLFSHELGEILYHNAEAAVYVSALIPILPVMYLDTTVDNILKGLGEHLYCMAVNVADAVLSILLVLFFLPRFGTLGYVAVLILAEVFNFSFSIARLYRRVPFTIHVYKDVLAPLFSSVFAAFLASRVGELFPSGIPCILSKGIAFFLLNFGFLFLTGSLDAERRDFYRRAVPDPLSVLPQTKKREKKRFSCRKSEIIP